MCRCLCAFPSTKCLLLLFCFQGSKCVYDFTFLPRRNATTTISSIIIITDTGTGTDTSTGLRPGIGIDWPTPRHKHHHHHQHHHHQPRHHNYAMLAVGLGEGIGTTSSQGPRPKRILNISAPVLHSGAGGMSRKRVRIEPWCGCSCERPEDRIPLDLDPSIPTAQCRCTWCGKADEFGGRRCGVKGFFVHFCEECLEGCGGSKRRVAGQAATGDRERLRTSSTGTTTR